MRDIRDADLLDFGEAPPVVTVASQQGVSLTRQDRAAADAKFPEALARDPTRLATHVCLGAAGETARRLDALAELGASEGVGCGVVAGLMRAAP